MTRNGQAIGTVADLAGTKELREENGPETGRTDSVADGKEGARSEEYQSMLGRVNRHWYRRRLDALDQMLRGASRNPGIEETRNLCDSIITSFLTAVTGQGPDTTLMQFPSDRACYIPFTGDKVGKFQYAKSYYQFPERPNPEVEALHLASSLWSFFPYLESLRDPAISSDSVDENAETVTFQRMLSVGVKFEERERFAVKKALLLSKKDRRDLREEYGADFGKALRAKLAGALAAIFEIYRELPGNSSVELLLFQHLRTLDWLAAALEEADAKRGELDLDRGMFRHFLRAYFLDRAYGETDSGSEEKDDLVVDSLIDWLAPDSGDEDRKSVDIWESVAGRLKRVDTKKALVELAPDLKSFKAFMEEGEKRLETVLDEIMDDNPLKAGKIKRTLAWVIPDYADLDKNMPPAHPIASETEEEQDKLSRLNELNTRVLAPLKAFFQRIEITSLRELLPDIDAYWRTRGKAGRDANIYASFEDPSLKLAVPDRRSCAIGWERPQSVFLRVMVSDSLNEPQIDGLFCFTTDRDEYRHDIKNDAERREDVEDLLAFARVFFFTIRDYFYGQDRAREASDIGDLNQHLFSKRLDDLQDSMEKRSQVDALEDSGITEPGNWDKFLFSLLNNYAFSLIDQPPQISRESFPFDRLLIMPIAGSAGHKVETPFSLPFYYFQSLFLQRKEGKIQGGQYALIKPFQSPIDAGGGETGFARTFQQEFQEEGSTMKLAQYLEKTFLGGCIQPDKDGGLTPDSAAMKAFPYAATADGLPSERRWDHWAIDRFWEETAQPLARRRKTPDPDGLWRRFLVGTTRTFHELQRDPGEEDQQAQAELPTKQMWFLYRFGFLSVVLDRLRKTKKLKSEAFKSIRSAYLRDLKLLFDDNSDLDVMYLAGLAPENGTGDSAGRPDPYQDLSRRNDELLARNPLDEISYVIYDLGEEDPLMWAFLKTMTRLARNDDDLIEADGKRCLTWYQPILTRPLEEREPKKNKLQQPLSAKEKEERHKFAGKSIGNRVPPYTKIAEGKEKISLLLGAVKIQVGDIAQGGRSFRATIALIRDYDDIASSRVTNKAIAEEQLNIDRRDLSLYSATYFQTAETFMNNAVAIKRLGELSREIPQIGRNWYSKGVDTVVKDVRRQLEDLVKASDARQLGRFQPALTDCLFESMVKMLLGPEDGIDRDGHPKTIEVESFPFDRVVEIPLCLSHPSGARLSYARTVIADCEKSEDETEPWGDYAAIRNRGRVWDAWNGRKMVAERSPFHIGSDPGSAGRLFETEAGRPTALTTLLAALADVQLMDRFVATLYEANRIQALAEIGLLLHLLRAVGEIREATEAEGVEQRAKSREDDASARSRTEALWDDSLRESADRLQEVLRDLIRGLERESAKDGNTDPPSVQTDVHMEGELNLGTLVAGPDGAAEAEPTLLFGRIGTLPVFKDLFRVLEGDRDYLYGLGKGIKSKVFFVYYSISAPDKFIEMLKGESHYRGVFCFMVDDADTDEKRTPGSQRISDAEIADREDIRTLVHNTMGSLRQLFEQQGLHREIRQPGTEQFIIGMLHRLKNELGSPNAALRTIRRKLLGDAPAAEADRKEMLRSIEEGENAILGIKSLFSGLKSLNDIQGTNLPLQKFSSEWLACTVLHGLCKAALALLAKSHGDAGEEINQTCDWAAGFLAGEADQEEETVEQVQERLHEVQRVLLTAFRPGEIRLSLSFQVFSTETLYFLGSHFLSEAINTLTENAFQAFWSYAQRNRDQRVTARLGFVCRPSETTSREVLFEIRNSSNPEVADLLGELNADVPAPISVEQHTRKSGKKGGSGFGHYYARRIISMYCGGRESRRALDARMVYEKTKAQVRLTVNLVKPNPNQARKVPVERLKLAFENAFKSEIRDDRDRFGLAELTRERNGLFAWFPGDIEPDDLFARIRLFLGAERRYQVNEFVNLIGNHLCGEIIANIDAHVVYAIEQEAAAVIAEEEDSPLAARARALLAHLGDAARFRSNSFADLSELVAAHAEVLGSLAVRESKHRAWLELLTRKTLSPQDMISDDVWSFCEDEWPAIQPFLRDEYRKAGVRSLGRMIDLDDDGIPVPDNQAIENAFRAPHAGGLMKVTRDGMVRFAVRFFDGKPGPVAWQDPKGEAWTRKQLQDRYRIDMVGYFFLQYRESLGIGFGEDERELGRMFYDNTVPGSRQSRSPYRTVYLELNLAGGSAPNGGTHE